MEGSAWSGGEGGLRGTSLLPAYFMQCPPPPPLPSPAPVAAVVPGRGEGAQHCETGEEEEEWGEGGGEEEGKVLKIQPEKFARIPL